MDIYIFTDSKSLIDYFQIREEGESLAVLDLVGDAEVRKTAADLLMPSASFTPGEKERIMDEYVETISEIGALNLFSIHWLCHPMSEKNDLLPDNLFGQIVDFLVFYRSFSHLKDRSLALLTQNHALINNVLAFTASRKIKCRLYCNKSFALRFPRRLAAWLKRKISTVKALIYCQYQFIHYRYLWKKLEKNKSYTIIRSWFDGRSYQLINKGEDIYFGRLPGYLKANGHNILYFGEKTDGSDAKFEDFKGKLINPVVLERSLLNAVDFFKASWLYFINKYRIKIGSGIKIINVDVNSVIRNYFLFQAKNPHIRTNYLSYFSIKKLSKKLKVDAFYMLFENYTWEKLSRLVLSEKNPEVKVIAFQHAQVALTSTKFFLGKAESTVPYLPDKIITLGEVTRKFLLKKNYPANLIIPGSALRHDYSLSSMSPKKQTPVKRILVQLWSFERSVRLINFIHASKIYLQGFEVKLNPHPCHPMEKLIPHLNFTYNKDDFLISENSLYSALDWSEMVIYHGTTTCLDALALGVPVVNVEFDDFLSLDPLFAFNAFKWNVNNPAQLEGVVKTINDLKDADFELRQAKGLKFVKQYFYPVDESGLRTFLLD